MTVNSHYVSPSYCQNDITYHQRYQYIYVWALGSEVSFWIADIVFWPDRVPIPKVSKQP